PWFFSSYACASSGTVLLTPEAGVGEPFTLRVDWTPSAFFGVFFGCLLRDRNSTNGGFPSSLRSRSTPRIKRQISSLVSGSSESQTLNSSSKRDSSSSSSL